MMTLERWWGDGEQFVLSAGKNGNEAELAILPDDDHPLGISLRFRSVAEMRRFVTQCARMIDAVEQVETPAEPAHE